MSNQQVPSSGGIGLFGMTFLVFLVMKLMGIINWSWWWVTAPLWGGFIITILLIIVFVIIGLLLDQ